GTADTAAAALVAERDELAAAGRELETLRMALAERARTRTFLERRLAAIAELEPGHQTRLTELGERATAARAERATAGARLARAINADDGVSEAALSALRDQHREAERALRECEKRAENLKDELSELVREAAVLRGRLGDLAGERADLSEKLRAADGEIPALGTAATRAQTELAAGEAALLAARDELRGLEDARREAGEREIEARSAADYHGSTVTAAREALALAAARAERILPNGAGERLRSVLESFNGDRPAADPAMLLEVIKAPAALEPALRAVLGDELDAVIVESPRFALRAIEILKEKQAGRLSFIPESITPALTHQTIHASGIVGRLLDMVEVEPRFGPLAEAVMGHVIVAEDLRAALSASNLNGYGTVFVTREGDVFHPGLMIRGGSSHGSADGGWTNGHDGTLTPEGAAHKLAEAEAEHAALVSGHEQARMAHSEARQALEAADTRVQQAERAAADGRAAIAKAEQLLALAEASRNNANRRVEELGGLVVSSNARLEELARLEQEARARLNQGADELAEKKADARRLGDAMLEAGAKVQAREARISALEQELHYQRRMADEVEAQIAETRVQLERAETERADFQRELENLALQDDSAAARHQELAAAVEELTARCAGREREVTEARAKLERTREVVSALEAEALECNLKRERARTLIEELERGFVEKFQAEFAAVAAELEAALAGRDIARDDQRQSELRAKAERIGEVNLAAESEVKELEERAGALSAERADLQSAVTDLTHTIQRLNREARKRFAETFEGAAKNFEQLFPKLLRGGKGRLELTAADDVLEAGVNILVQPAGKKVKEIGLLSGGEKALSAMALIFSLFLLNPSPFCIMDEVDAPLDEFSLAAFTSLVCELKERSQFIVITHNQRTMQAADNIHGVTMERPGISRVISLTIPEAA
ncbi:MAG: hypothetical protein ACREQN_12325, partial [Candidatus Binataceae bacterium]